MVTRSEDRELSVVDRAAFAAHGAVTGENVRERAEVGAPRDRQLSADSERDVRVRDGGVGDTGTLEACDGAGDEPDERAAVVRRDQTKRVLRDRLVARTRRLQRWREVDPQL